jgi:hypothetical protein
MAFIPYITEQQYQIYKVIKENKEKNNLLKKEDKIDTSRQEISSHLYNLIEKNGFKIDKKKRDEGNIVRFEYKGEILEKEIFSVKVNNIIGGYQYIVRVNERYIQLLKDDIESI